MATCSDPSCNNPTDKEGTLCKDCRGKDKVKAEHKDESKKKVSKTEDCPLNKFKITNLTIWVDATTDDKLIMNDPDRKVEVKATMSYIKTSDTNDLDSLPTHILFTFTDPSPDNTKKSDSYKYSTKYLGKKDDASAKFWEAHSECSATSSDGFKIKCKVQMKTLEANKKEIAKVYFKPSGVGGDDYKIKATVFRSDGITEIVSATSNKLTVWRKINYNQIYTMQGETYIDTATTHTQIAPAFENNAYVLYSRGNVTTLASSLTIKYISLYKSGGGTKAWPADFSPSKLETTTNDLQPTNQELIDYGYTGTNTASLNKKASAKLAIEAKAQKWFNAIMNDRKSCVSNWFSAASVSGTNALLALKYDHPKLSGAGDGATNFWPSGISINLANPGSGMNIPGHPDQATWRKTQGFNYGKISVIFKNYGTALRLQIICRHEIGHATKSAFKREKFGAGDHSSSGLMTAYGDSNTFSNTDIKILRGFKR